jgi:prepilin-type N-terminal cleavage/methylation domain-containing protein
MVELRSLTADSRGLTLIEVLVAMVIMSVVLVALGGLMFDVARQTRLSAATTYRSAAAQRASAWVEGMPWDSLSPSAGCASGVSGQLTYDRCLTVVDSTPRMKIITVVVTPTGTLTATPDTFVVIRNRARSASPMQ